MKHIYIRNTLLLFIFPCLIFPLLSYKTPDAEWVSVQLDSTISVQFPGKPVLQTVNGVVIYAVRTPEAICMAMIMDQTPSPGEKPIDDVHSFYLGFMDSMIRNVKGSLSDSTAFTMGVYKGMDFTYTSVPADGNTITRRNRAVLIKNKLYSFGYTFSVQPTEASRAVEKHFLETIQLIK